MLKQLLCKRLDRMPLLLRMLDSTALLDMLLAFFQAVTGVHLRGGGHDGAGGMRVFIYYELALGFGIVRFKRLCLGSL